MRSPLFALVKKDVKSYFDQPTAYILIVPFVAVLAYGTLELLLTHPVRGWIVLLSKFLAGFIFVAFAVLATVGIPIAVTTAGNLDIGAAVGQYVSSLFLAAAFVSIGLFTSSLTRNQIVAFILGLSFTMTLMVMGLDIVAVTLPPRLASLLQDLSPVTHFSSIARGVIHLRDVLYFVALISTFLSATFLVIRGRTLSHSSAQYRNLQRRAFSTVLTTS